MKRWTIVHEDEDIIVVDKPALFPSIPDRYDNGILNVKTMLKEKRPEVIVTHRIEKETSGLMLFSKSEKAHKFISGQYEKGTLTKIYKAITTNTPPEPIGQIDLAMTSSEHSRRNMALNVKGKLASTRYKVVEAFENYCLLDIKLLTDRMHQIRLHMSSIYCPLACDKMYGEGKPVMLSHIKRKYRRSGDQEKPLMDRVALHCSELEFLHPRSKEKLTYSAPLPKDMKAVLNQLRKNAK